MRPSRASEVEDPGQGLRLELELCFERLVCHAQHEATHLATGPGGTAGKLQRNLVRTFGKTLARNHFVRQPRDTRCLKIKRFVEEQKPSRFGRTEPPG